ncbi:MAG: putative rane protein [Pedosphaera sp.]|nr:putative rane protein [Pedosphaera sp.]
MEKVLTAHASRIAWLIFGFFIIWSGLAVAAALPGGSWLHRLFSPTCHQAPERCYEFMGHPIGLCVRCLFIYLGLALGHPVFARWQLSEKNSLRLLGTAGFLVVADVLLESMGLYDNCKSTRAVTGGLFGFACAWFTLRGLSELSFNPEPKITRHEST